MVTGFPAVAEAGVEVKASWLLCAMAMVAMAALTNKVLRKCIVISGDLVDEEVAGRE